MCFSGVAEEAVAYFRVPLKYIERLEEEVEMGFTLRVRVAEDGLRAWTKSLTCAVSAAVTPLADLGYELQVAQELVVDEIVVASQAPQKVRPAGVHVKGELGGPG